MIDAINQPYARIFGSSQLHFVQFVDNYRGM